MIWEKYASRNLTSTWKIFQILWKMIRVFLWKFTSFKNSSLINQQNPFSLYTLMYIYHRYEYEYFDNMKVMFIHYIYHFFDGHNFVSIIFIQKIMSSILTIVCFKYIITQTIPSWFLLAKIILSNRIHWKIKYNRNVVQLLPEKFC